MDPFSIGKDMWCVVLTLCPHASVFGRLARTCRFLARLAREQRTPAMDRYARVVQTDGWHRECYSVLPDGTKHGEFAGYYGTNLILSCVYREGKLNGPCKEWSLPIRTRVLKCYGVYVNSDRDGTWTWWRTIGYSDPSKCLVGGKEERVHSLDSKKTYKRGVLHGISRDYDIYGVESASWLYQNGELVWHKNADGSVFNSYGCDGRFYRIEKTTLYTDGESVEYHQNGLPKSKSMACPQGLHWSSVREYDERGRLLSKRGCDCPRRPNKKRRC